MNDTNGPEGVEQHYTVRRVSELLDRTAPWVRTQIALGHLPAKRLGRKLAVAAGDLKRFLDARQVTPEIVPLNRLQRLIAIARFRSLTPEEGMERFRLEASVGQCFLDVFPRGQNVAEREAR
jgi:hypothetical protein